MVVPWRDREKEREREGLGLVISFMMDLKLAYISTFRLVAQNGFFLFCFLLHFRKMGNILDLFI